MSNATLGEKIYVLYEGEELQNGSVVVRPPVGEEFEVALGGNAAQFNASIAGRWSVALGGEEKNAFVFEERQAVDGVRGARVDSNVLLLFMLLLFACVFAFAAFAWRNVHRREVEFYQEGQALVLKSAQTLQNAKITDAQGSLVWSAQKFDRVGGVRVVLAQMHAPFCMRAQVDGQEICIFTNCGEKAGDIDARKQEVVRKKLEKIG